MTLYSGTSDIVSGFFLRGRAAQLSIDTVLCSHKEAMQGKLTHKALRAAVVGRSTSLYKRALQAHRGDACTGRQRPRVYKHTTTKTAEP